MRPTLAMRTPVALGSALAREHRKEGGGMSAQRRSLGEVVRWSRLAAGLSQAELAERAGLSRRGVSDIERGVITVPHQDTLARLADALGLDGAERSAFRAAARVRWASPLTEPSHPARDTELAQPPLVGREQELALIERHLADTAAPLLIFAGEPGIGKSRLLAEVGMLAAEQGWRVIAGGCTPRSQASYEPFVSALAREVRLAAPARQRLDLQGCGWLVRLLPELLETQVVPAPTWSLPPEQERRLIFDAVGRFLGNVAGPAGTLLVLDDLQWAGGDALALLERLVALASQSEAAPLRVLGAYRTTDVRAGDPLSLLLTDLIRDGRAARRQLEPLSHEEAALLLEQLWAEDQAHPDATSREEAMRRAEGLPFYLVSSAQALRDGARQGDATARWRVPVSVAESVRARVVALPETARRLAEVAAVAGRIITASVVMAVSAFPEEETLDALDALAHAGLLAEEDTETYRFTHDLIREVVEDDLGSQRRRSLHRRLAEALEADEGMRTRHAADLAFHFAEAGERRRALCYALLAGNQAEAVYAHAEAEGHYHLALTTAQELGDHVREAEALEKLGLVLKARAYRAEALEVLEHAAQVYEELGDTEAELRTLAAYGALSPRSRSEDAEQAIARLVLRLAMLDQQSGNGSTLAPSGALFAIYETLTLFYVFRWRWAEADAALERAEQIARTLGDEALLLRMLSLRMRRDEQVGGVSRIALALELMAQAERVGDIHLLMQGLHVAFNSSLYAGELAHAQQHVERWVALAERVGMSSDIATAHVNRSELAFYRGDWREARLAIEQARTLSAERERLDDPESSAFQVDALEDLDLVEGRDQEAVKRLSVTLAWARKRQWSWHIANTGRLLAERDLVAGRAAEAQTHLQELLSLPGTRTHAASGALALPYLAWAEAGVGEMEQAAATVEDGIAWIAAAHCQLFLPDALRIRALIAAKQQRWEAAEADAVRAIKMAQAMPYPHAELKALYVHGQLHEARGEPAQARECFEQALLICDRLGEGLYRPHIERALKAVTVA
jgi:transcriptional regulator with XRE-family HTH domain/tetratricopeptide (TPR) repeat protein